MINKIDMADDRRRQRAADYVAHLYSGEMTESDEYALEVWLKEDILNQQEYQEALSIWDDLDSIVDGDHFVSLAEKTKSEQWYHISKRFVVPIAAAAVIMLAVMTMFVGQNTTMQYGTAVGEQKHIQLSDGSKVTLNTNSRLMVQFNDEVRHVALLYGEAFFDVEKDASRPFTVVSGKRSVTVLGTQFTVKQAQEKLTVAVREGTVVVHESSKALPNTAGSFPSLQQSSNANITTFDAGYQMQKGAAATFYDDRSTASFGETVFNVVPQKQAEEMDSWRFGKVGFENVTLQEMVLELNRYSRLKIVIGSHSLSDLRVSGVMKVNDIKAILTSIEEVFPIKVLYQNDRIVLSEKSMASPKVITS